MPTEDAPVPEYKSKYPINPTTKPHPRMSCLIWGPSGSGKTIFASTAPSKRLILLFDPDGDRSLKPDTVNNLVMDLSNQPPRIVEEAKDVTNPFGLNDLLTTNQDIQTVIVDSVTAFSTQAVAYSAGHRSAPGAVFENPSMSGYGFRNRFVLGLAKNLLTVTGKHNRHIIFICHEDVPKLDDKGAIVSITVLLGGSLSEEVPLQISEVWNLRDTGTARYVTVRATTVRKPMKSRMFDTRSKYEFKNDYDSITGTGITIASILEKWKDSGYDKIAVP